MRGVTFFGLLQIGAFAELCADRELEVIFVQDGSSSFASLIADMEQKVIDLYAGLSAQYDSVKFGITAFSDKPIPFRGVGGGRGIDPAQGEIDYCYKRLTELTDEVTVLQQGFVALSKTKGAGGDAPENPYEGLLYAIQDPTLRISSVSKAIKFAVIATDDVPHYAGDGQLGINWWMGQGDQGDYADSPHFWDPEFIDSPSYYPQDAPAIYSGVNQQYTRLIELHKKSALEPAEDLEYQKLISLVGPSDWDSLITHPGSFEAYLECPKYEYPALSLIAGKLQAYNVYPLVLVAPPPFISSESAHFCEARGFGLESLDDKDGFLKCLAQIYTEDLTGMGLAYFAVEAFVNEADSFVEAVSNIVNDVTKKIPCGDDESSTTEAADDDQPLPCAVTPGHSSGAVAGVAVGCASVGAAAAVAALALAKPAWLNPRHATLEDEQLTQVAGERAEILRDQTQILKVDDFA